MNDEHQLRSMDRWTWKYLQTWLRTKAGLQVEYVALREAHDDPDRRLRNITTEYRQLRRRMDTDISVPSASVRETHGAAEVVCG